jgi:hypothetical protein
MAVLQFPAMRKLSLYPILFFVFSGFAFAQSKCSQFGAGETKSGTFTNPLIGISYSVPANLKPQDVSSVPKATNASQGMYLLLLWREPQTVDKPNVIFMAEDPSVYNDSTAMGYAKRIERTATQQWKATMLEPIREFDLNGVKFYRVDYKFPGSRTYFNTSITGQVKGCELSINLTGTSPQEIDEYVSSLKSFRWLEAQSSRAPRKTPSKSK